MIGRNVETDWTFHVRNVIKVFGDVRANDGITLEVHPGEVYGLLGPNGAGKTTLVKQIIGLLKPTSGELTLGPYDLVENPDAARQLCSYLPQAQMPIDSFKTRNVIALTGMIRGGDSMTVRKRADELIEELDIGEWADTIGAKLSGGVKRLVGFAMVTAWPGRVVIIDEPTNDVDPRRRRLLWEQIRRLGDQGAAVLLVTHNVLEAEKSVDCLAIIDEGRLIAEGTPSSLKSEDRGRMRLQLMIVPGRETPEMPAFIEDHTRVGNNVMTVLAETDSAHAIGWAQELIGLGIAEEYALAATTLEDVYIRLTGRTSEDLHAKPPA
ncbi:daunorubicin/doxorubicin resistance ATP-binding protein DrrA [bacterium BMS3Abin02]|nr:daunorubicin/doxorubicin resistance ATP-binding protein DrrA [bacterium BMS3Abin02]